MSPQQRHGAGDGFPAFVFHVDVADMVDVGALWAGMSVGGAVPVACQAVELGHADTPPVEHCHLSLQDMRAAVERE